MTYKSANMSTLLFLPFEVSCVLTFDHLTQMFNRRSDQHFLMFRVNMLTLLVLPFRVVCNLTFDPLNVQGGKKQNKKNKTKLNPNSRSLFNHICNSNQGIEPMDIALD